MVIGSGSTPTGAAVRQSTLSGRGQLARFMKRASSSLDFGGNRAGPAATFRLLAWSPQNETSESSKAPPATREQPAPVCPFGYHEARSPLPPVGDQRARSLVGRGASVRSIW